MVDEPFRLLDGFDSPATEPELRQKQSCSCVQPALPEGEQESIIQLLHQMTFGAED
jgi:hypothetical protein